MNAIKTLLKKKIRRWQGLLLLWSERRKDNADLAIFAYEGLFQALMLNLATAFTNMYATRLGATATEIGLISSGPQFFAMLLLIPASLLASRSENSRRPVEISALLTGAFYGLAASAPFMGPAAIPVLILFISLGNALQNVYNSVWQNYFSTAVPVTRRNKAFSFRTSLTFLAATISVLSAGKILSLAADDLTRIRLYQLCYVLAFVASLIQFSLLRRSPEGERSAKNTQFKALKQAFRQLLASKRFSVFAAIVLFFHAGWYMGWPLFFITEVHYCGADESWLSLITVSGSLVQLLTVKKCSSLIERKGSHKGLILGMLGLCLSPFSCLLASIMPAAFRLPTLLLLNMVVCAAFPAFTMSLLQRLLAEIPQEQRNLNLAIFNTGLLAVNALMQMSAIWVYQLGGENLVGITIAQLICGTLRVSGTLLYIFWSKRAGGTVAADSQ